MLDHLVYAVPDLDAAVRDLAERLGVAPSPGGQHIGRGSRNCLLSLGNSSYLEIIGPDPDQPSPPTPRPFGLDALQRPCLIGWAIKAPDIERRVEAARAAGYDPGPVLPMSRRLPDGTVLSWKLTHSAHAAVPDLIPFLIEWGSSPHPSSAANHGVRLVEWSAESPDTESVQATLRALGAMLNVRHAERSALIADVAGPAGQMTL